MRRFLLWFVVVPAALFAISIATLAFIGLVQFFAHVFG